MGDTTHEIAGPVEGVDQPDGLGIRIARAPAFLSNKAMIGVGLLKMIENFFLGGDIHIGDKVCRALRLRRNAIKLVGGPHDNVPGFARRTQGYRDHGFHIYLRD